MSTFWEIKIKFEVARSFCHDWAFFSVVHVLYIAVPESEDVLLIYALNFLIIPKS